LSTLKHSASKPLEHDIEAWNCCFFLPRPPCVEHLIEGVALATVRELIPRDTLIVVDARSGCANAGCASTRFADAIGTICAGANTILARAMHFFPPDFEPGRC
jgi:hypothetical protein